MAWQALLEGRDRERALARVEEIAAALETAPPGGVDLAGGKAGIALLHAYRARAGLGDDAAAHAEALLGDAIDGLAAVPLTPSLYGGFTGVAWVAEHLAGGDDDDGDDGDDGNQQIDGVLADHLAITPWPLDYDLVTGLVGFGVYGLARAHRRSGRAVLERVIARLDELAVAEPHRPGRTYLTPPQHLVARTRALHPRGYYNCGVAHGVPGVVALLGAAIAAGVATGAARPLFADVTTWLLAQRDRAAEGLFPYAIDVPRPAPSPRASVRCAWCYGDPGAAAALLWAGLAAGEPACTEAALEAARASAARREGSAGVVDAGICHGAAGLALVYDRIWQASGDQASRDAATFWARRTLDMHRPGEGLGGYVMYGGDTMEAQWQPIPGVLTGSAGVALALLACATDIEPRWDAFLLASAPPRGDR